MTGIYQLSTQTSEMANLFLNKQLKLKKVIGFESVYGSELQTWILHVSIHESG